MYFNYIYTRARFVNLLLIFCKVTAKMGEKQID